MNQRAQNIPCWGVDVASEHLDMCEYGVQQVQRIANDPQAIQKWLRSVPAGSRIGLESTGRYHLELARQAHARGLTVYLLNPRDIKRYAQGLGQRGKTDRLDARVIARFVDREHEQLRAWQPHTPQQRELADLLRERAVLQKTYSALMQSVKNRPTPAAMLANLLREMKVTLDAFERAIDQAACELPDGQSALRAVTSIPGIGVLTGAALLKLFTRAPDASADAIVALTGLDPRPMDSGNRKGVRRLSKRGDSETRRLLYNAANSGARTDAWRTIYEREKAKGLPRTGALMALARRLLRLAFSLFKSGQRFDQARIRA